jgi:putative ABC transport system permease protein
VVKALHTKLLRDLRHLWSQALTIALVVGSGIAGYVTSLSAVDALAAARDDFYRDGRFADGFVVARRVPLALLPRLQALPGVAELQPTVAQTVRVELPDSTDPVTGLLVGASPKAPLQLNRVVLRQGAWPAADGSASNARIGAVVSAGFALARGLKPGD